MKRLLAMTALVAAQLGCVANQGASQVRFLNARLIIEGPPCTGSATDIITGGQLDVAGKSSYLLAMSVATDNITQPITVNQVNFQGTGLGDINFYQLVYSYEFSNPETGIVLPKEESVPIYAVFRPQTDPTANFIFLDAIGPQALAALQTYYRNHTKETGTIVSHINAKAYYSSGQEIESNIFRFPVTVYSSTYSPTSGCAPSLKVGDRCGSYEGQDSDVCVPATPTASVPSSSL